MSVNILDLARPESLEAPAESCHDDVERSIPRDPMTTLDHFLRAILFVAVLIFWAGISLVLPTLFHLHGLAALVVMVAWPLAFVPLILFITEVIRPLGRRIRQKAARIESCND